MTARSLARPFRRMAASSSRPRTTRLPRSGTQSPGTASAPSKGMPIGSGREPSPPTARGSSP
eukprot:5604370-Alexandrium_andersonii.AAC.1